MGWVGGFKKRSKIDNHVITYDVILIDFRVQTEIREKSKKIESEEYGTTFTILGAFGAGFEEGVQPFRRAKIAIFDSGDQFGWYV